MAAVGATTTCRSAFQAPWENQPHHSSPSSGYAILALIDVAATYPQQRQCLYMEAWIDSMLSIQASMVYTTTSVT